MARNTRPKCRVCRRAGEKLFLKGDKCFTSKCPIVTRNFPPGTHGPTQGSAKNRKMTDFGKQMKEKQKAKNLYGLLEKQFRAYVDKAIETTGNSTNALHALLEHRLDNVVFRGGFAPSRAAARQLVSHGLITVKGKPVTIASYQTSVGEEVGLKEGAIQEAGLAAMTARMAKLQAPSFLSIIPEKHSVTVSSTPTAQDVAQTFNATSVIEFYSR